MTFPTAVRGKRRILTVGAHPTLSQFMTRLVTLAGDIYALPLALTLHVSLSECNTVCNSDKFMS